MPESLEFCVCVSLDPVVVVFVAVSSCGTVELKLVKFVDCLELIEPSLSSTGGGDTVCTVDCLGLLMPDCLDRILDLVGDTLTSELAELGLSKEFWLFLSASAYFFFTKVK